MDVQIRSYEGPILRGVRSIETPCGHIGLPFGMLSRVDPKSHVLDGVTDPDEEGNFEGMDTPRHARLHSHVNCTKTAELIEIPFGL